MTRGVIGRLLEMANVENGVRFFGDETRELRTGEGGSEVHVALAALLSHAPRPLPF